MGFELAERLKLLGVVLLMEKDEKKEVQNGGENEGLSSRESERVEELANGDEDSESNSLLAPRKGGMSRKTSKTRRKVQ